MPPAGVSHLLFDIHSHILKFSITQLGILAHAFPPSRARSLAFATFASGSALGSAVGNVMGGVLTEFTKYESSEFSSPSFFIFTSTNLFDPEKHGVPHSTF